MDYLDFDQMCNYQSRITITIRMLQNKVVAIRKQLLAALWRRSLTRQVQYPTKANAWHSVAFLVISFPIAVALFPLVVLCRIFRPIVLHVLVTESEFGHLVALLEYARTNWPNQKHGELVVIQAKHRHLGLANLYQPVIGPRLLWSHGTGGLIAQALLLIPDCLISRRRYFKRDADTADVIAERIRPTSELSSLGQDVLKALRCQSSRLVLLSVHTKEYDLARTPGSFHKDQVLETDGQDLVEAIDYLSSKDFDLIRVGGRDSGRSFIPREILRLEEFSRLGGLEEVALASECTYFWADEDGGWWLSFPFRKPVLLTNLARIDMMGANLYSTLLCVPLRYQRPNGDLLSFAEVLRMRMLGVSPYKKTLSGELCIIRNTPTEIRDAHKEMLARVNGSWETDDASATLQHRIEEIWAEFPMLRIPNISQSFLAKHQYLLR